MAPSVYLDMDPGHDDALALLVALATLSVRGLTTVAGNQTVDKTYLNARRVLFLAQNSTVPVAKGCAQPLFRELVTAGDVHGQSGLDGYDFPVMAEPTEILNAMAFLERSFMAESSPVQWIATGPLTNLAAFLMGHPELIAKVGQITFMGGALDGGNVTPYAEFNIFVDPDAAAYVVNSGIPMRMVGLDVTHRALLDPGDLQRFLELGDPIGVMLFQLFSFYGRHEPNAGSAGMPIHDVLAVAAAVDPSLFVWQTTPLAVERCNETHRGATRAKPASQGYPEIEVAVDIDVPRFFAWMWQALSVYRPNGL